MRDGTTTDTGARYVADLSRRITTITIPPAKCPACDGWGKRPDPNPLAGHLPPSVECPACKGTGVLWPPKEER